MFKSKKLTFSLASFVILVALALVPVALAAVDTVPVPTLSVTDVSAAHGNQLEIFQALETPIADVGTNLNNIDTQSEIDALLDGEPLIVVTDSTPLRFYIRLTAGYALLDVDTTSPFNPRGANAVPTDGTDGTIDQRPMLHISDLVINFYDRNGAAVATAAIEAVGYHIDLAGSVIAHRNRAFPDGRNFEVSIAPDDIPTNARYMTVVLPGLVLKADATATNLEHPGSFQHANPVDVRTALIDNKVLKWNKTSDALRFELVNAEPAVGADNPDGGNPNVVSIVRAVTASGLVNQVPAEGQFGGDPVYGDFNVKVTFTEEPLDVAAALNVDSAKVARISKGAPFYVPPSVTEGNYSTANPPDEVPPTTGRDARYHPYLVTLTPNLVNANDVVIRIQTFSDRVLPPNSYRPPSNLASQLNRSVLRVPVLGGAVTTVVPATANEVAFNAANAGGRAAYLPGATVIPANGYLVLARGDAAQSGVRAVGAAKYADDATRTRAVNLTDADFSANVVHSFAFPAAAADFSNFFRNGGSISLGYSDVPLAAADASNTTGYHGSRSDAELAELDPPETIATGDIVISEIMWGRDAGLDDKAATSQWIELHNTTAADISIDANEWVLTFGTTFGTEIDSVGNDPASGYWAVPGSAGNTNPTGNQLFSDLVSMSRIDATVSGSDATNWVASELPSINLTFGHIGTPGVANRYAAVAAVTTPTTPVVPAAAVAKATDIVISEIMVASNDGRLPQWIELSNVSATAVSLSGWSLEIDNDSADADVVGESIELDLGDVEIGADQVALVISKASARNSGVGDGDGDLRADRIIDVQSQVSPANARYSLISEMGFMLSLIPPRTGAVRTPGDVVGNLGGGWELPASEGARSSLIRRELDNAGMAIMGTDAAGWVLASSTNFNGAFVTTYYGDEDDEGTPGYDAGGALPVELSGFNAARDRVTGAVVITWSTQSELNNAGFFIKRSQQQKGKFVVVNPTMISGAGTTAEKQSYTFTDATADPNIVYFYQIEDVSLDGNRQTLTRAHRLKGHIGAAGKATTTWGDLKSSRD